MLFIYMAHLFGVLIKNRCEYGLHPDTFPGRRAHFLAFRATALSALNVTDALSPAASANGKATAVAATAAHGRDNADGDIDGGWNAAASGPTPVRVLVVQRPDDRAIVNLEVLVTALTGLPCGNVAVAVARFDRMSLRRQLKALSDTDVLVAVRSHERLAT